MSSISSNNKRLAKNTMYLYVRSILTLLVTLYTSRVILDQLGVIDYGIYNVVASVSTFMTIISGTLSQAVCRFTSYEITISDRTQLRQLYSSCLNVVILASIGSLLVLETVGLWFVNHQLVVPEERLFSANIAYQGSIVLVLMGLLSVPFNAFIVAHEDMKVFAGIAIIDVFLRLGIALSLSLIGGDKLAIYAILLVVQSVLIISLYYIHCKKNYEECFYVRVLDRKYIKKLFSFSGWTFLGSLSFVCKESGINFILNIFFGPVVNAARAVAGQVINSTSILGNQFLQATIPQITKLYAENKLDEMHLLISRSCRYAFLLFFLIAFPVFCFTPQILGIWLVEVPELSSGFIRILLFHVLIKVMSSPLVTGINASGVVRRYQIIFSIIEISALLVAYLVLKMGYGPLSSAIVIVLAELIQMICKLGISKQNYNLSILSFIKQVGLPVFPIILSSIVIFYAIRQFNVSGVIQTIVWFTLVALINATIIYVFGINKREKDLIKSAVLARLKR